MLTKSRTIVLLIILATLLLLPYLGIIRNGSASKPTSDTDAIGSMEAIEYKTGGYNAEDYEADEADQSPESPRDDLAEVEELLK